MFGNFNIIHTGRRDIIKPLKKLHVNDFHRFFNGFHRLFASLHKLNLILKSGKYVFHYSKHHALSYTVTGRRTQGQCLFKTFSEDAVVNEFFQLPCFH